MQPLLSILIPTRNRAYYLRYAIQSAINIPFDDIEIIVSENYGDDDGWQVANSFSDPRLSVLRPDRPLPMHENFEFLLRQAAGKWITFIGDDDAILPYAPRLIHLIDSKFPGIEVICSERAHLVWPGTYGRSGGFIRSSASSRLHIRDSKNELEKAALCLKDYIYLPQVYSGGFFKRSLVSRVRNSQNNKFFLSAVPDAYSCVAALKNTYRYIDLKVPLSLVGTSPSSDNSSNSQSAKNRENDYYVPLVTSSIELNGAFGKDYLAWPFYVHFHEALCAYSAQDSARLSYDFIKLIVYRSISQLLKKDRLAYAQILAFSFGVKYPSKFERFLTRFSSKIDNLIFMLRDIRSPSYSINRRLGFANETRREVVDVSFDLFSMDILDDVISTLGSVSSILETKIRQLPSALDLFIAYPPWDPRSKG